MLDFLGDGAGVQFFARDHSAPEDLPARVPGVVLKPAGEAVGLSSGVMPCRPHSMALTVLKDTSRARARSSCVAARGSRNYHGEGSHRDVTADAGLVSLRTLAVVWDLDAHWDHLVIQMKTDPKLVVDADGVLPFAATLECFEAIFWGRLEILKRLRCIEQVRSLRMRDIPNLFGQVLRALTESIPWKISSVPLSQKPWIVMV